MCPGRFPQHKALSQEEKEQNLHLKEWLEVVEYPRLIILDPNEREIARLGYPSEEAEKFADDLIHIVQRDKYITDVMSKINSTAFSADELRSLYQEARDLQRAKDADTLLAAGMQTETPLFFLLEKYRLLVEEGKQCEGEAIAIREKLKKADPQNHQKVHFSLALIDFQSLAEQEDIELKDVICPLENYIKQFGSKDPENVWRVEMMIAQFYLDADENKIALKHAELAFESAPVDKKGEIQQSLDYIREQAHLVANSEN